MSTLNVPLLVCVKLPLIDRIPVLPTAPGLLMAALLHFASGEEDAED